MKTSKRKTKTATGPPETEATQFVDFVKQIIAVPKSEIDRRQAVYEASRARTKKKTKVRAKAKKKA